ncbi:MAG TPA: EpsI family protein [Gemmatimonadales bacterium]|nr:EpsI family protein [Gemmatimonadales bacterium]
MREPASRYTPLIVLGLGCAAMLKIGGQSVTPLAGELSSVPKALAGFQGRDQTVNEEELRVAGMDAYLLRIYQRDSTDAFSLYVGYYQAQTQGKTIHSPKNCLPGAGWEPVESRPLTIPLANGELTVNRYLLEKGNSRAIVYYWYQGRGRTAWNEYAVKWELLRDKALHGRSEEALVRIVVPLRPDAPDAADSIATSAAREVVPALDHLLAPLKIPRQS